MAFRKQFAGKAYLKITLLVKTPLQRRSMEVRRFVKLLISQKIAECGGQCEYVLLSSNSLLCLLLNFLRMRNRNSFFTQSSRGSAGLERAKWPGGELETLLPHDQLSAFYPVSPLTGFLRSLRLFSSLTHLYL